MATTIKTDVVDCNIPLLLSKASMKRVKLSLDFDNDTICINRVTVPLKCTASGHYALPLSR